MTAISRIPDAMSDVLSLVRMRGELVCANEFSAPWALSFRAPLSHFHIVERGVAYIRLADSEPIALHSGDLAILPRGTGHLLSSDQGGGESIPIEEAIQTRATREGAVYRMGGGGAETHVVCGQFSFLGVLAPKLLTVLPHLMHLRGTAGRPLEWLRLTTQFLIQETREPRPGSAIMISRLLDLMFIQAVRTWAQQDGDLRGWLAGLTDPGLGRALSAIHENPARDWTVNDLAAVAGMSRSAFAARFNDRVGASPLKYVSTWRLDLAADRLKAGGASIADIASRVGYGSEAAFTRAFKAQFGMPPAAFRRAGVGV